MPRAIAVDWSGAATGAERRIWIAEAVDGVLETLEDGRSREQVIAWLCERRPALPAAVVGLDFSFSFPTWFLGDAPIHETWERVEREGEQWLADCPPPFWGRPGRGRGEEPQFRVCEEALRVGAIAPKSTFQIGGAGAVGTGSLRGIPHLPVLRDAGWSIWPFDPPTAHVVAEIWPRLLTGPVAKSSSTARASWLATHAADLPPDLAARAATSEDAFDAAASALVLSRADLAAALAVRPPGDPREGAILMSGRE